MFLFWVNGPHIVKATWSSSGWWKSEPRADILLVIGQSMFCFERHWSSQELSKQVAPSLGITPPVCTHAGKIRVDQWTYKEGRMYVCTSRCLEAVTYWEDDTGWKNPQLNENVLHDWDKLQIFIINTSLFGLCSTQSTMTEELHFTQLILQVNDYWSQMCFTFMKYHNRSVSKVSV